MTCLSAVIILTSGLFDWVAAETQMRHESPRESESEPAGGFSVARKDVNEGSHSFQLTAPFDAFVQLQNSSQQQNSSQPKKTPPAQTTQTSHTDSNRKSIAGFFISLAIALVAVVLWMSRSGLEIDQSLFAPEGSVQAALCSVSKEDYDAVNAIDAVFEERIVNGIPALCDEPSIYVLMWASRSLALDQVLVFGVTVILQLVVPLYLLPANTLVKNIPATAPKGARATWPLILVFTISTIKGTLQRLSAMFLLRKAAPGWELILVFGAFTLSSCSLLTIFATANLFFGDMAVGQILLNACAVNFIPDVDKTLVSLVGSLEPHSAKIYIVATKRLQKISEVWPTSKERTEFCNLFKKPMLEQLKTIPFVFLVGIEEVCLVLVCFVMTIVSLAEIGGQVSEATWE